MSREPFETRFFFVFFFSPPEAPSRFGVTMTTIGIASSLHPRVKHEFRSKKLPGACGFVFSPRLWVGLAQRAEGAD